MPFSNRPGNGSVFLFLGRALRPRCSDAVTMHPAKDALFEDQMLSELLKARMNDGAPHNLFFWRNKTGNEVDVVIDESNALTAIEIKAGESISRDYFKGLDYFAALNTMKTEKFFCMA